MTDTKERPNNVNKDADHWKTGDESMTGAQASYLQTLCEEAGGTFDPDLTKADAWHRRAAGEDGRGKDHSRRASRNIRVARPINRFVENTNNVRRQADRGARGRARVSASEVDEVEYFAQKHGVSQEKARERHVTI